MKINKENIDWLLSGDVSIIYQVKRDLLDASGADLKKLQLRIAEEGWGKEFMRFRNKDGLWGGGFYLPKWTSAHYTLLDIKNLGFPKGNDEINYSVSLILDSERSKDGGISYSRKNSDVCVNGMILNFGSYLLSTHKTLNDIVDYLLNVQMEDGGWNCKHLKGATHSSLHSTLSVLEGLLEFTASGNTYRIKEIKQAEKKGIEFLLVHHLFKSHRTGKVIDPKMLMLPYPSRWRYDILRVLDYLQKANAPYDKRMDDALSIIRKKQNTDGCWSLQGKYQGLVHFDMEKTGTPSRWNTLRALRVLKHFQ
ncbi:MAG TPA: prenyltransferase/squalene oxidase repeat-containing protein [Bacteroidia bacterium]|nr:prenyltransferase/squalene oxidase repeat-containing protein [Bacteroidia bacterium]